MRAPAIAALLWAALPGPARGATSQSALSNVSVTVPRLDLLALTSGGVILLDSADADPTVGQTIGPDSSTTGRLNYTHNQPLLKKVTAQVTTNPAGHDITLTLAVAGGTGTQTLVLSGTAQPVVDVYLSISAGALFDRALTYTASCTATGTTVSAQTDFAFTVTFTTADN